MDNKPKTIWTLSGVNSKGEPFVQLRLEDKTLNQFTPAEAREFGQTVMECAEAADTDAFLFSFGTQQIGLERDAAMMMIMEFRKWREARAGVKVPTKADFAGPEFEEQRKKIEEQKRP